MQRTDLDGYLQGRIHIAVVRPPYKTPGDVTAALDFARAQIGKPYNQAFDTADSASFHCAEYVCKALKATPRTRAECRPPRPYCLRPNGVPSSQRILPLRTAEKYAL